MDPQPHAAHLPPPSRGGAAICEGHDFEVFMQAFDDRGERWAGIGPVPVRIETSQTLNGTEIWLVASFTWMHDGPSPRIATLKVTGWSADNDYLLTPTDSVTHCHGKGAAIVVRIPARILE